MFNFRSGIEIVYAPSVLCLIWIFDFIECLMLDVWMFKFTTSGYGPLSVWKVAHSNLL